MSSPCKRYNCTQCCMETEMPLSNDDVKRIEKLGFDRNHFVINNDGWLQLRNLNERCVFNDGKKCTIYDSRPEGCKFYPVIYDESEKCATLDEDCPHRDEFKISDANLEALASLVAKLNSERKQRK